MKAAWWAFRRWFTPGPSVASWHCLRCTQTVHGYGDTLDDAVADAIRNGNVHGDLAHAGYSRPMPAVNNESGCGKRGCPCTHDDCDYGFIDNGIDEQGRRSVRPCPVCMPELHHAMSELGATGMSLCDDQDECGR